MRISGVQHRRERKCQHGGPPAMVCSRSESSNKPWCLEVSEGESWAIADIIFLNYCYWFSTRSCFSQCHETERD